MMSTFGGFRAASGIERKRTRRNRLRNKRKRTRHGNNDEGHSGSRRHRRPEHRRSRSVLSRCARAGDWLARGCRVAGCAGARDPGWPVRAGIARGDPQQFSNREISQRRGPGLPTLPWRGDSTPRLQIARTRVHFDESPRPVPRAMVRSSSLGRTRCLVDEADSNGSACARRERFRGRHELASVPDGLFRLDAAPCSCDPRPLWEVPLRRRPQRIVLAAAAVVEADGG